ncbi:major ampullate spidroin 2B variant 1, partial [Trichonephila inaurata madagascariensis]
QDYGPVIQAPSAPVRGTAIGLRDYRPVAQAPSATEAAIRLQDYVPVPQAASAPLGAIAIGLQNYVPVPQASSAPLGAIAIGLQNYGPVTQAPSTPEEETSIGLQDYGPIAQTPSAPEGATAVGLQDYGSIRQAPTAPEGATAIGLLDYVPVPQAPSASEGATAVGMQDYRPVIQAPSAPIRAIAIGLQDYGTVTQTPSTPEGATAVRLQDYVTVPQALSAPVRATAVGSQDYGSVPQVPSASEEAAGIRLQDYVPVPQALTVRETAVGFQDFGSAAQALSVPIAQIPVIPATISGAYEVVIQGASGSGTQGPGVVSSVATTGGGTDKYGSAVQGSSRPEEAAAITNSLDVFSTRTQETSGTGKLAVVGLQNYRPVTQVPSGGPGGAAAVRMQDFKLEEQEAPGSGSKGLNEYGPVVLSWSISEGLKGFGPRAQGPSGPGSVSSAVSTGDSSGPSAEGTGEYGRRIPTKTATAEGSLKYEPEAQVSSEFIAATSNLGGYGPVAQGPSGPSTQTYVGYRPEIASPDVKLRGYGAGSQGLFGSSFEDSFGYGPGTIAISSATEGPGGYGLDIQRPYLPGESPTFATTVDELGRYGSTVRGPSGQDSQSLGGSGSGSAITVSVVDRLGRYNQDTQGFSGPGAQELGEIVETPTTAGVFDQYRLVPQGTQRSPGSEGFYSYSVSSGAPGYRPTDLIPSGPSLAASAAASRLSAPDSASRVSSAVSNLISSGPTNPVALSNIIGNAISQISAINPDLSDCDVLVQAVLEAFSALLNIFISSTSVR